MSMEQDALKKAIDNKQSEVSPNGKPVFREKEPLPWDKEITHEKPTFEDADDAEWFEPYDKMPSKSEVLEAGQENRDTGTFVNPDRFPDFPPPDGTPKMTLWDKIKDFFGFKKNGNLNPDQFDPDPLTISRESDKSPFPNKIQESPKVNSEEQPHKEESLSEKSGYEQAVVYEQGNRDELSSKLENSQQTAKQYIKQNDIALKQETNNKSNNTNESKGDNTAEKENQEQSTLTDEEKTQIKEETGWSDEIIDAISSMDEYRIYKNAGLIEAKIGDKPALIRPDLDLDYVDPKTGLTNREIIEKGGSPIDAKTGEKIELHHIGQNADSPLAELTVSEHRQGGNDSILHDKAKPTWRNPETESNYNTEKKEHWQIRLEMEENKNG